MGLKRIQDLKTEQSSFKDMDIDSEEKAFYDILKSLTVKYDFAYPNDKLITLSKDPPHDPKHPISQLTSAIQSHDF